MKRVLLAILFIGLSFDVCFSFFTLANVANESYFSNKIKYVPSYADLIISSMDLHERVSSLLILHRPGTDYESLNEYLMKYQPGGFIFMGDNIPESDEDLANLTAVLQKTSRLPYLFAVDEEGSVVSRLPSDVYLAASELKDLPVSATSDAFRERSQLLNDVGLNVNFGIVADLTDNKSSFIYNRVFGGDVTKVSERIVTAVNASKNMTLSTLKHFPGHGSVEADSHMSVPTTDMSFADWSLRDRLPFEFGINVGADVVMFGHLCYSSVDDVPASLSTRWHEILRKQLNFNGISITDDMKMLQDSGEAKYSNPIDNAITAINAGNTMLLYVLGSDNLISGVSIDDLIDGIVDAVNDGRIDIKLINKNVRKTILIRHSLLKMK